jgi:hypothetical protein
MRKCCVPFEIETEFVNNILINFLLPYVLNKMEQY